MRKSIMLLSAASTLATLQATVAFAADAPNPVPQAEAADDNGGFADIIVTARREAESLQSVPVAVSVLTDEQFRAAGGTFRPENISASAPSVNTTAGGDSDRSNIIFTIRGQSFTYGALYPSVITYFADVPTQYLPAGSIYDVENLQVLRGPQGVQFGRVTNGGNIMIAPHRPTFDLGADITLKAGDYNLIGTTGFANLPVSDTVAIRLSWDITKRDGFTKNTFNGKDMDDVNYKSGRIGILWKPSDRFENYFVGQVQYTDDNGTGIFTRRLNPNSVRGAVSGLFGFGGLVTAGSDLGFNAPVYGINPATGQVGAFGQNGNTLPLTADNYVAATQQHVARQAQLGNRRVFSTWPAFNRRKYAYAVNTTTFDFSDNVQLKNIFGYTRYIERSAQSYSGDNSGYVQPCHSICPHNPNDSKPFWNHEQFSEELRLSGKAFDGRLTWSLGGYMDEQRPAAPRENATIFGGILEYRLVQLAKTRSRAVYGYGEYELLDGLKINGGIRYTHDTVDSRNANYNSLLPVPGLQNALFNSLKVYRDIFGVPGFQGLPDAVLQGMATGAANGATATPHGQCLDYNYGGLFSGTCTRTKGKFNSTTWTFGGSYQLSPRQLIYAKYSKGYRPGGVNATFPAGFENLRSFAPENVFSFEAGVKADWDLGVPVRTNLTFFKDRYKKIQQSVQIRDTNGNPGSIVTNVAAAKIWGVEFEGSIRPFEGFTLSTNYSFTKPKYNKDGQNLNDLNTPGTVTYNACNAQAPINLGFCTFNKFSATPKHQLGINADLEFVRDEGGLGTMGIGAQWYYQSKSAQSNATNSFLSPEGIMDSYSTLNLNARWNGMLGSRLDLGLFLTNVTNEIHWVSVQANTAVSSIGNVTIIQSPPRMFGGSLTAHF